MRCKSFITNLIPIIILLFSAPVFAQLQSADLISKFYSDPNIEINTPGFSKAEGFMSYNEMMLFLENQVKKRSDILRIKYVGKSTLGKKIPVVFLGKETNKSTVKIWMQGGLHGNEPAGTESLLMFIDDLIGSKNIDSMLNFVSFAFIPMANIDGYEKQVRDNENKEDLNRDQVKLEQAESVFLKQAFSDFSPAVAIDFHEFRPIRKELDKFSTEKLAISQDVLFLPSGNLNIPSQLRDLTNLVYLKNLKEKLTKNSLTFDNYFVPDKRKNGVNFIRMGGDSPRSSSSSYGLTNAVSILFEIRGIGLERNSYKRRVYSGFLIATSILETTLQNREKVAKTVETAIKETIKRTNPIVVKSASSIYQGTMNFIDINNLKYLSLPVEVEDAGKSKIISMRDRPKAYLLLAENAAIAKKLQTLGLQIDTLKTDQSIKIEVYTIPKASGDSIFQVLQQKRTFPKGSFVISTAQKNANLAVSALEPEMENGFYKYKMITAKSNGEIPIYRCLTDLKSIKKE